MEGSAGPAKHRRQGANVCTTPVELPAAARARWLAEVAETLEQAQHQLDRLSLLGHQGPLVAELQLRIAVAKKQVESLQSGRPARTETDPRWTNHQPWGNGR